MAKYIFVTGGVVSSLGKGIVAASIGVLLKSRGLKVTMQKFDPYINVDPGLMSPLQHGEVFVTKDGAETDLDLGHYERFIDENLTKYSSVSSGRVYKAVIDNERQGKYLGKTVQVIPHITDEIKRLLKRAAANTKADVVIVEVGGTVGDIESLPFLEAIRQTRREFGEENTFYIHATLVPYLKAAGELKTKPTQHSVKELKSLGIQPDMLVLRSEEPIEQEHIEKISLFTDINTEAIFQSYDVPIVYEIILNLQKQKIDDLILNHFKIRNLKPANLSRWEQLIQQIKQTKNEVKIAIIGKYVSLHDAYISLIESLKHAGWNQNKLINIIWIDSEKTTKETLVKQLDEVDGILIPGGFGQRGIDGKMWALEYGRTNLVPTLGICFGMQLAAIEFAKNVLKLNGVCSDEFDECGNNVIRKNYSNRFKLGEYATQFKEGSKISEIYGANQTRERHRHRFEFNHKYVKDFEDNGMLVTGFNRRIKAVDVLELKNHPWYIHVQYHPEYISRPLKPHPLFIDFVKACAKNQKDKN
ncbi:MAG: CTP synthase [Acholeplasmataceae bacterium]|jgi:CTP synthase